MKFKKEYKNKVEEVRERFAVFKRSTNSIYWLSILNVLCIILILIKEKETFSLGFATNILIYGHLINNFDFPISILISSLVAVILALIFFFLSKLVKEGKLIPLIITNSLYFIDTIILFLIPQEYFLLDWNKTISIIVHIIALFYLFYLLYQYIKIVKVSKEHQLQIKDKKENNN